LLEAWTSEIEHLGSCFPFQQCLYFSPAEWFFEEITLIYFYILLRKKLLRLATGISFHPAKEVNTSSHLLVSFMVCIFVNSERREGV